MHARFIQSDTQAFITGVCVHNTQAVAWVGRVALTLNSAQRVLQSAYSVGSISLASFKI